MTPRIGLELGLAALFAALVASCVGSSSVDTCDGGTYVTTHTLTPQEYAQWQMGMPPASTTDGSTTVDATSTGAESTTAATDGTTTGDATTGGSTTGAMTTAATSTGEPVMWTDAQICDAVCKQADEFAYAGECSIGVADGEGNFPVSCTNNSICLGRRHLCVVSRGDGVAAAAAGWFARAAHDEAASIAAFEALGDELTGHGAPARLLEAIAAAVVDERRHAVLTDAVARRLGAVPRSPTIVVAAPRDLVDLAIENAVEGCVAETWAALVNAHQAERAADPELRRLYAELAADEARHAELAWAIHTWLMGQVDDDARRRILSARRAAVDALGAALSSADADPELIAIGLPDPASAARLHAGLDVALWAA